MSKFKIGQEVVITDQFDLRTSLGKILTVKKGDKAFIDSKCNMHYLTGEAVGKIQSTKDIELDGYDLEHISNMICVKLSNYSGSHAFLNHNAISISEFRNEIEEVLSEIL